MPDLTVPAQSQAITDAALEILQSGRSVAIPAHPGAGKTGGASSGTVRMAAALAGGGRRVALLVAQNDQVVETVRRLLEAWPRLNIYFAPASAAWRDLPDWIRLQRMRPARLRVVYSGAYKTDLESGPGLFVMTAAKFSYLWPAATAARARPGGLQQPTYVDPFDVCVLDEAWMHPSSLWINLAPLARLLALIGDPGQILPFTKSDRFYPGMFNSPIEPLPELAARELGDQLVMLPLNVSRRLASHTTRLVGQLPAYADAPTRPMFDAAEVPLVLGALPLTSPEVARTLRDMSANGLALHRLPSGNAQLNDPVVARACAELAIGLGRSRATLSHPEWTAGPRPLADGDIAVLVAHHEQKAAVRRAIDALDPMGRTMIRLETFNAIQGATVRVGVVWHPLSGRADVSEFHADVGRLTVGLSRHTHGCILVSRDGIADRIDRTPSTDDQEGDAPDRRLNGLLAHRLVWDYFSGLAA